MNSAKKKKISPFLNPNLCNIPSLRILGSSAFKQKPLRASTLLISSTEDHHAKLGEYAARLWKDKAMTDVIIVVETLEFKAHKAVLACHSPYFNEVLSKPGFNEIHYVKIPNVTSRAFEILLEYMYTGKLRVTCQELSEVYRASRRLKVKGAVQKCLEMLQVSPENFQHMVYLYVTSRNLDLLDASVRSFKLMTLNFEKLITTKEFLDLEIHQLVELFSADEIGARSEIIVFMAALKWINYRYLDREEYITDVFRCIRFPLMTTEEILVCYHPPLLPGIMIGPEIKETLLNATCYITSKSLGQEKLFSDLARKPRNFQFGGEPLVLWDVSVFDPEKFQETKRNRAATRIQAAFRGYYTRKYLAKQISMVNRAATVIQAVYRGYRVRKSLQLTKSAMQKKGHSSRSYLLHRDIQSGVLKAYSKKTLQMLDFMDVEQDRQLLIYAMGAFDAEKGEEGVNTILNFDAINKSWTIVTRCPTPRHDSKMAVLNDFLYVIGGYNPLDRTDFGIMLPLKECLRFHPSSGEWREIASMNNARSSHAVVVFKNQVLAIGGKDERNRILSSIEKFDLTSGKWREFTPLLPEPRAAFGAILHRGSLWIAGGISTTGDIKTPCVLDSVWCLDYKTCRWTKRSNLPLPLVFPALMSDDEQLFCVGGATLSLSNNNNNGELESTNRVYLYDRNRWIEQYSIPISCHKPIGYNIGKKLYFLGGFSSDEMTHLDMLLCVDLTTGKTEYLDFPPSEAALYIVEACVSWQ